jgi:hypothetical protein
MENPGRNCGEDLQTIRFSGSSDLSVGTETASISVRISTKAEPPVVALEVSLMNIEKLIG